MQTAIGGHPSSILLPFLNRLVHKLFGVKLPFSEAARDSKRMQREGRLETKSAVGRIAA